MKGIYIIYTALLLFTSVCFSQEPATAAPAAKPADSLTVQSTPRYTYDALAPSKAAFFSGVLPGLGQIYNKKYWKAPIVWGAIGVGIYSYTWNQGKYKEYRNAYKDLLAGKELTGRLEGLDASRLESAQKFHQRNRDLSALVTVGIYLLNIVDANVDAHLRQFNVDDNLTLRPEMQQNDIDNRYNMGFTLSYRF